MTELNDPSTGRQQRVKNRYWYVLLIAPFVGTLWLPFYARATPRLFGFPFFYWWQFLWVIIAVALTAIVYWLTTESDESTPDARDGRVGSRAADR